MCQVKNCVAYNGNTDDDGARLVARAFNLRDRCLDLFEDIDPDLTNMSESLAATRKAAMERPIVIEQVT